MSQPWHKNVWNHSHEGTIFEQQCKVEHSRLPFQLLSNSVCISRLLQASHSWIYRVIFKDTVESEVWFPVVGASSELLAKDQHVQWRSISSTTPFAIVIHPIIPVGCHQWSDQWSDLPYFILTMSTWRLLSWREFSSGFYVLVHRTGWNQINRRLFIGFLRTCV
jgi:hypothetical protein